jgi:hypothetical protein
MVRWDPFVEGDILQPADLDQAFKRYHRSPSSISRPSPMSGNRLRNRLPITTTT